MALVLHLREVALEDTERNLRTLSLAFAENLDRSFQTIDLNLSSVIGFLAINDATTNDAFNVLAASQDMNLMLKEKLKGFPQMAAISIANRDGKLLNSSRFWPTPSANVSERHYFHALRDDPSLEFFISEPVKGPFLEVWRVLLARRLNDSNGEFLGVIASSVALSYYENFFSAVVGHENIAVSLMRQDGTLLVSYPFGNVIGTELAADGGQRALRDGSSGTIHEPSPVDGFQGIKAVQASGNFPLAIVVSQTEEAALSEWRRLSLSIWIISAVFIGLIATSIIGYGYYRKQQESLLFTQQELSHQKERAAALTAVASAKEATKRAEAEALNHAKVLQATIDNMPAGIRVFDKDLRLVMWNQSGFEMLGFPAVFARVGTPYDAFLDFTVKHGDSRSESIADRLARAQSLRLGISEQTLANGRVIEKRRNPMPGGGFVTTYLDITERSRAEHKVREAEELLRASLAMQTGILNIAPEAIIAIDESGTIKLFNAGAERVFGHAADVVIGRPIDILLPERYRPRHLEMVRAFGSSHEPSRMMARRGRISGLRSDGTEFPAEASIAKVDVAGERLYVVILRDVTERIEEERVLTAAKEAAESANRAKSEFLANMSHELRTPLNAIIGFSEMMSSQKFGPLGDKRYGEYTADIANCGKHLLSVFNDILDVATIEAGRMCLNESAVDLGRTALESSAFLKATANNKGVAVAVDVAQSMPRVLADECRMKQIVLNLLSNAVKFTPEGGAVTVQIAIGKNGEPTLVVSDTGIGIPSDQLPYIGQPFVQADAGLNRHFEGSGLGLAISKALTELHGGTLTIETEFGCGTTVTARLPPGRVIKESTATDIA